LQPAESRGRFWERSFDGLDAVLEELKAEKKRARSKR